MKTIKLTLLFLIMAIFMTSSIMAGKKDRKKKLPVGSYITSAKIEITSLDPKRVPAALGFLRDLAEFYGPHSEAYFWRSQIYVDYVDYTSSPMDKKEYVEQLVIYSDSLRATCGNEEIKKKYRKGCDDFAEHMDSVRVLRKREFYNDGTEKITEMEEIKADMESDSDTSATAYYEEKINGLRDTALAFYELSIILDSADALPWIGIGNMLQELGKPGEANVMLVKALPIVDETIRGNLLIQIGYNYVNNEQYTESIEYIRTYIDNYGSDDVGTMTNMAAIYNQVTMPDSARNMYQRIIEVDSSNVEALRGVGSYYRGTYMKALDSVRFYSNADDEVNKAKWIDLRQGEALKAKEYLEQAYNYSEDTDTDVAHEYSLILYLLEDFETAVIPFTRLVTVDPTDKDSWITLGDCYLRLQDFDKCARAYEKVVELDPDNRPVWESLEGLYKELKETENLAEAQKHLK